MKNNTFAFIEKLVLVFLFIFFSLYGFTLANKRYENFEYGKFDLGNMAQTVWNSSNGHFMEVTDQFGTNMPRWGMSHVDPILLIFVPLINVFASPMVLVLGQQIVIASSIFPLFWLVKMKLTNSFKSALIGYLVVMTYMLYPANGFTVVWTGFHGISFVAPFLIWMFWLLEKYNFFVGKKDKLWLFWLVFALMLMGKEEVGAMTAIVGAYIYTKNKRLGIKTIVISLAWFIFAFFILIPRYSDVRRISVKNFITQMDIHDVNAKSVSGSNFFLQRYDYLGDTYPEMVSTFILHPRKVFKVVFRKEKIQTVNFLIGPLGYIVLLSPFWIISMPDIAITVLSKEPIFDIFNHRIAFVTSSLFLSYVYFLAYLDHKNGKQGNERLNLLKNNISLKVALLVMFSTFYFSAVTQNPIFVSGISFLQNKVVKKALAIKEYNREGHYVLGKTREAKVPRNSSECLKEMVTLVDKYSPDVYTGPDYLGANTSLRYVNALFPARFWDADFVIADLFETKTVGPLGSSGWTFNKDGFKKMLGLDRYKHLYSCDKVSAFVTGRNHENATIVKSKINSGNVYFVSTSKVKIGVEVVNIPAQIERNLDGNQNPPFVLILSKEKGEFSDKTTFWTFEKFDDSSTRFSFIDYVAMGFENGLDNTKPKDNVLETYHPVISNRFPAGKYRVFYGVGDLLEANEAYIGDVSIK